MYDMMQHANKYQIGVEHSLLLSSFSEAVGKGTPPPPPQPAHLIRVGRVIPSPLSQAVPAGLKTADQYFLHTLLSTEHELRVLCNRILFRCEL